VGRGLLGDDGSPGDLGSRGISDLSLDAAEIALRTRGEGETEDEGENRSEADNSVVETTLHLNLQRF
jgi:hypothetical protein